MKIFKLKSLKLIALGILGFGLAVVIYGLLQLIDPVPIAPIAQATPVNFAGRGLLIASDADMVATAYADGVLEQVVGIEDTLTVIDLPLNPEQLSVAKVPVSNSVQSWPQIIATSPNGKVAYIVESRGQAPDHVQVYENIEQMPAGSLVAVVDISDPAKPRVIESVAVGENPGQVSISPDGKYLAIDLLETGRELAIAQLKPDGRINQLSYFPITNSAGQSVEVNSPMWHPSGQFLTLTLNNKEVAFYRVQTSNTGQISLQPYREPVKAGNWLTEGCFTPDGRFYLIPDVKWQTHGQRLLNYLMNPKGELVAIRFVADLQQTIQPKIVSKAEVGLSPEGFALSPDGTLIVTVNMRRTYLPNWLPAWRGRDRSSLSLVQLNPETGELVTLREYGFEGLLPEDAVFDAQGKTLAVAIFNDRIPRPKTGRVEFWNVIQDFEPRLERTGFKLEVVRGPHTMMLVK